MLAVILERIDVVNKLLQEEMIELKAAVNLLKSLSDFVTSQRDILLNTKRRTKKLKHDFYRVRKRFLEKTSSRLKPIYRY